MGNLMGNLTADPELRYTPKGTAVTDIRLAINRYYAGDNSEHSGKGYRWRTLFQSSGSREQGSGATQWPGSISTGVRSAPTVSG